jgi:hypothetical protein
VRHCDAERALLEWHFPGLRAPSAALLRRALIAAPALQGLQVERKISLEGDSAVISQSVGPSQQPVSLAVSRAPASALRARAPRPLTATAELGRLVRVSRAAARRLRVVAVDQNHWRLSVRAALAVEVSCAHRELAAASC